ncbi:MAG: SRPBCC domain-containing protein [Phenylobacterium sp.]|uniref:SRPBCC domain-containing protein n=1 Tax=Phenylobacterium sp. TaxID=1871053 RepID=UPI0011F8A965|nr:SRPBCC domain-containing protein [Phenylobacterium sp.]TAL36240.1 MAG: SRPBCC domain-containing protein [Phenylobacterium sp.]
MMIDTEIEIAAPPMKVWRALCDFRSYRKWNPCRDVVGVAGLGEEVTLMIGFNPNKRRNIGATISAFEPGRSLSFRTGRFFSSDTESFAIEPGRRGTLLRHSAELTGLSVMFMRGKWFESNLCEVYDKVNMALNQYVTSGSQLTMAARNRRRLV